MSVLQKINDLSFSQDEDWKQKQLDEDLKKQKQFFEQQIRGKIKKKQKKIQKSEEVLLFEGIGEEFMKTIDANYVK